MLALIAGLGRLPVVLARRLCADGVAFQVYELAGFRFENPDGLDVQQFRIEGLGSLIDGLVAGGAHDVCFAGSIKRPVIDLALVDTPTKPLLDRMQRAIDAGDDGALRAIVGLFEGRGLSVRGVTELVPELLPQTGVLTRRGPDAASIADARIGWRVLDQQGRRDSGQACVIAGAQVVAQEGVAGTEAMLAGVTGARGGILFKGPKPDQDRRVDLPAIGVQTVAQVARAGLAGIVVEAGGVIVLDRADVVARCDAAGLFLSAMERP